MRIICHKSMSEMSQSCKFLSKTPNNLIDGQARFHKKESLAGTQGSLCSPVYLIVQLIGSDHAP